MVTYSSAISACEKSLEWEAALELMSQMPAAKAAGLNLSLDILLLSACSIGNMMLTAKVAANQITYNSAPQLALTPSSVASFFYRRFFCWAGAE